MLRLSRAMVDHAEAILCQMCSAMLLDLCPRVLSPRSKILSGFWRAMLKQHFGPRLGPSLAILGPVKVSGSHSSASCGKVAGSWGQVGLSGGHVESKLGYVMSCWSYMSDFVRPCCWFCIQKCSPPSRTKILSRFLRAMLAPFVGSSAAILWLCWHRCHHLGINFGHRGAMIHEAMWARFGGCNSDIAKVHPKLYLQNALPRRNRINSKNHPKKQNLFKNANPDKTQPKISQIYASKN